MSVEKRKRKFIQTVLRKKFYPSLFQTLEKIPTDVFVYIPPEEIVILIEERWREEWESITRYMTEENINLFRVTQGEGLNNEE